MDILIALVIGAASLVTAYLFGRTTTKDKIRLKEIRDRLDAEKRIKDAIESIDNDDNDAWRDRLRDRSK